MELSSFLCKLRLHKWSDWNWSNWDYLGDSTTFRNDFGIVSEQLTVLEWEQPKHRWAVVYNL